MPLAYSSPILQPAIQALEATTTTISTPMLLAHPPPNQQPALLALKPISTILPTSMPLAHPPSDLQPAFLARNNLNLSYQYPCHLLIQQSHPPPYQQTALLTLEPTSTILPSP